MFKPWIGENYAIQNKPKILILGESHYGDAHVKWNYPLEEKTILCIQQQIDNSWTHAFYTKLAATFIGHKPSIDEKKLFWNTVAYHNLITVPLISSRIPPTEQQWKSSLETLKRLIVEIQPDYCLVVGFRMWDVLKSHYDFEPISLKSDIGCRGAVFSPSLKCLFHGIKHPSGRGFKSNEWHQYVSNLKIEKWC